MRIESLRAVKISLETTEAVYDSTLLDFTLAEKHGSYGQEIFVRDRLQTRCLVRWACALRASFEMK